MPISTGGMGEVFLARLEGAHGFDKLCVIKKILSHLAEDAEFTERFVNEARVLVKLSHGNIAQVLDMGLYEQAPYIALEFIDGKDLRRIVARMRDRQLPIPLSFVLFVMTRVLDALAYAHRKVGDDERELSLVHRDVSPQNVLISYEGEVKVIDFGLAKSTLSSAKTNPSIILGKFMYMSPEQARQQKVDRRSDLYAVGLCLYELVCGHSPFEDVPPGELMAAVASPKLAVLNAVEPMCPQPLSEAVMKALEPDPVNRWQTAEEFRSRLQVILNDLDPSAGAESASRFMRDAFSTEYGAERKMLSSLKEAAKNLDDPPTSTATSETKTDLNAALIPASLFEPLPEPAPVPLALEPVIHPEPTPDDAVDDDDEVTQAMSFEPTPLSFEPTKKTVTAVRRSEKRERERERPDEVDGESHTHPSISVRTRDTDETLDPVKDREKTNRDALTPSVVLDGVEAEEPSLPKTVPMMPAVDLEGLPEAAALPPPPRRLASGSRTGVGRKDPVSGSHRVKSDPKRARVAAKAAPVPLAPPRKKKTRIWAWLALPVLSAIGVASYIAWDLRAQRLVAQAQAQAAAVKGAKKKPSGLAARAITAVKTDVANLENLQQQRRFTNRLDLLTGMLGKSEDTAFFESVDALHTEVKAELAKQR